MQGAVLPPGIHRTMELVYLFWVNLHKICLPVVGPMLYPAINTGYLVFQGGLQSTALPALHNL